MLPRVKKISYVRLMSYVRLIIAYVRLISYVRDNKSYTYDLSSIYTASIMAHRVVNYVKSEADNTSVFLLMVKTAKYLEAFTYICKYVQSLGIPKSYLTSLSFRWKENLTYLMQHCT